MAEFNPDYRGHKSSSEGAREQSAHLRKAEAGTQAAILAASDAWYDQKVAGVGGGILKIVKGFGIFGAGTAVAQVAPVAGWSIAVVGTGFITAGVVEVIMGNDDDDDDGPYPRKDNFPLAG